MIDSKENLFELLINLFPAFKSWWEDDGNCNVLSDGGFAVAGLCAEFSQFYIEAFDEQAEANKEKLFFEIEELLVNAEVNADLNEIAGSLKVCFLENIAQTKAGEISKIFMGKLSRFFFDGWHVYP